MRRGRPARWSMPAPEGAVLSDSQFERLKHELEQTVPGRGAMPGGRCCSKAGSTGRRCRSRPRTWTSWRPSTPRRARSRSPSACRRCCSAFPATTPIRTTRRPTACSGAAPCCRWPTASAAALTQWLAPAFGDGLRLVVDTDQIEALSADRAALWERVTKAPFLTVNEKRAAVGYGAIGAVDRAGMRSDRG